MTTKLNWMNTKGAESLVDGQVKVAEFNAMRESTIRKSPFQPFVRTTWKRFISSAINSIHYFVKKLFLCDLFSLNLKQIWWNDTQTWNKDLSSFLINLTEFLEDCAENFQSYISKSFVHSFVQLDVVSVSILTNM